MNNDELSHHKLGTHQGMSNHTTAPSIGRYFFLCKQRFENIPNKLRKVYFPMKTQIGVFFYANLGW